jgi:calpain
LAALRAAWNLVGELKKSGKKWDDPEFGPNEKTDPTGLMSLYFYDNMIPPGCPDAETIEWRRPEEICTETEPKFFDGGASAADVMQSSFLGNCWFVSALSIIAAGHDTLIRGGFNPTEENVKDISDTEVKQMVTGIYPPMFHFLRSYGIYVMRFFKNYQWVYVMIDDKLPCLPSGDVVYGKCKPPEDSNVPKEFWVSLIEKAYAKVHNCYQALFSGYIDEALGDMTG